MDFGKRDLFQHSIRGFQINHSERHGIVLLRCSVCHSLPSSSSLVPFDSLVCHSLPPPPQVFPSFYISTSALVLLLLWFSVLILFKIVRMAGFDSIKKTLLNCFGVSTKAERLKSISYYGSLTISQINDEIKICDFFLTKKEENVPHDQEALGSPKRKPDEAESPIRAPLLLPFQFRLLLLHCKPKQLFLMENE